MSGSATAQTLQDFYDALLRAYGPQHWWPGETPTEVAIGAILTQNTNWKNVERAIANLRAVGALDFGRLHEMTVDRIAELIRPAGYFNIKARRLKNLVDWLFREHDGDLQTLSTRPLAEARAALLSISGIGRETADAILLYALSMPSFVIDAYTARVLKRHRLIDGDADYEQMKELMEDGLPRDTGLFNEYHALLVADGKKHCKPTAQCTNCPLDGFDHEAPG